MKTPEEKFILEIWWLLREIKGEQLASRPGAVIDYTVKNDSKNPSINAERQIKLLNKLKQWQIISIEDKNGADPIISIKINKEKFEKLYQLIENALKSNMPFDQIIKLSEAHGKHFLDDIILSFEIWHTINGRNIKKTNKPSKIEINYDEDKSILIINGKRCQLPIAKNEDYLCRAMFESEMEEPIDWSIIYEKISHVEPTDTKKNKKMLQDTIDRIHNRIEVITGHKIELFSWQDKTIKRNY